MYFTPVFGPVVGRKGWFGGKGREAAAAKDDDKFREINRKTHRRPVVACARRRAAAVYIKFLQQYAETSRRARATVFGACAGESAANRP